jgi:hypothetical protein
MRSPTRRLGALAAALIPALVAVAQAGEVTLDKVPKPVLETVKARFADATVAEAAKEKTPEGQEIYEVGLQDKNQMHIDVTLTPEGTMTLIEQEITRKALPAPVAKTLEEKYPKAKYRIVEEVIQVQGKEEKLGSYEVLVVTPKKVLWAVELTPDGKIVTEEKKLPEEED